MAANSDPIGMHQDMYPTDEYKEPVPNVNQPVDSIRIERLNFTRATNAPPDSRRRSLLEGESEVKPILTYDASITFAITLEKRARSWKVSLRHDTPFIAAYPCNDGPHVLFCDYYHRAVRVDELVNIQEWGPCGPLPADGEESDEEEDVGRERDLEEVLLIEAYGVADNEVFARAWCSFWGLPSIIADISDTCVACAVREAYACKVSVVILVEKGMVEVEVEPVDREMAGL